MKSRHYFKGLQGDFQNPTENLKQGQSERYSGFLLWPFIYLVYVIFKHAKPTDE